jgi:hypothetical protein
MLPDGAQRESLGDYADTEMKFEETLMRKVSKGGIGEQSRSGSTNLREKSMLLNKLATQKKI